MKAIEKIIFNELASRRAVVLSGVGTLAVKRHAAAAEGKELKAPTNEVLFSTKEATDAPTVAQIMERMGVAEEGARDAYAEWLAAARNSEGQIIITGVGTLTGDTFAPSDALEQILNPSRLQTAVAQVAVPPAAAPIGAAGSATPDITQATDTQHPTPQGITPQSHPTGQPHTTEVSATVPSPGTMPKSDDKKPNGNRLTTILLIIIAVLLLAILGVYLCNNCRGHRASDAGRVEMSVKCPASAPGTTADDTATQPTTDAEKSSQVAAEPASKKYHLIVGSFATESGADAQVARYSRNYPALTIEKVVSPNGRILVSIFQSDAQRDVYNSFYRIADQTGNWDMWVYEIK